MFNGIEEGGLNNIIGRRLGVKGQTPAPAVAPEIFPTITLENDRPEWGFLKGEALLACRLNVGALAANFSVAQMTPRAGMITTIVAIESVNTNPVLLGRMITDGGLVGWSGLTVVNMDWRFRATGSSSTISTNQNIAFPVAGLNSFAEFGPSRTTWEHPIVLAGNGGESLLIAVNAVNLALACNVFFRERPAVSGELV